MILPFSNMRACVKRGNVMLNLFQHIEKHRISILEILKQVQNDSFHTALEFGMFFQKLKLHHNFSSA